MNILIYNEFVHESQPGPAQDMYPRGIHMAISEGVSKIDPEALSFTYATLENHRDVITRDVLKQTHVLIWWGHMRHHLVDDEVVRMICEEVGAGMGLIVLHSGHESKVFRALMGTRCGVEWYEKGDPGRIWILDQTHPIVKGVENPIEIEAEETYAEPFTVPVPDELIGITWWKGGEIFRGMSVYHRGLGKIFYFHPGHETLPSYYNPAVIRVIDNAIHYVAPVQRVDEVTSHHIEPHEK
ncbi:MAG: ThuA domain-containing protein [Firmicutes bacterium]|nr:ThuA domain-containing protein [Bacillota bacterium]